MAFLEIDDMGTVIYDYQIEQIADGNDEALPDTPNARCIRKSKDDGWSGYVRGWCVS